MARTVRDKCNLRNRRKSDAAILRLRHDMERGQYTPHPHQVVGFYTDGVLSNAQHTLIALADADVPGLWLATATNVDINAALNIDNGQSRSLMQNLQIAGDRETKRLVIATLKMCVWSSDTPPSYGDIRTLLHTYRDVIEFVFGSMKARRHVTTAPVLAAILRAYIAGVDQVKLKHILHVLHSGLSNTSAETVIVLLRDRLMSVPRPKAAQKLAFFRATQQMIKHYLAEEAPETLRTPQDDVYPLIPR
jgi:hypothetical protein